MSAEGTIRKLNSEGEREEERPFSSSHLAPRGYSFFFQLEPPLRSGELPINKRQPAQRASGRNEDNARRGGAQINLLLDQ